MRWIRAHLVGIAGLLVLGYLLIPNLIVIVFSFNKPNGELQLRVAALLRRRLDQPLWDARHL